MEGRGGGWERGREEGWVGGRRETSKWGEREEGDIKNHTEYFLTQHHCSLGWRNYSDTDYPCQVSIH